MKADLHMHSVHSDGTKEVKEILLRAKEKELDIIALTDHDSVEGVAEAIELGNELGIKVIPGLELSTYQNDASVHILGYFPNGIPEEVLKFSRYQHEHRRARAIKMMENLEQIHGLKMNKERVLKLKGMITRAHMITEVVSSNPEYSRKEAFDLFLNDNAPAYIPSTKMSTEDGVNFLKSCGAFIVLAHPVLLKNNDINDFLHLPLDGIEAIYPKNRGTDEAFFRAVASNHNLCVTAGSDYHGIIDFAHGDLAYNVLEGKDLELFLERIGLNENN